MSTTTLDRPAPPDRTHATREEFEQYQAQARSWRDDKVMSAKKDVRYARGVSLLACTMAVLTSIGAVAAYHRPIPPPHVVKEDEATGALTLVDPAYLPTMPIHERTVRYMVWKFVENRESYSWQEDKKLFNRVVLMLHPNLQKPFERWWRSKEGHRTALGQLGTREAVPISITPDDPGPGGRIGGATVRFRVDTAAKPGVEPTKEYKSARMSFAWSSDRIRVNDALVNAYGFNVTYYHTGPETPQE